MSWAVFRALVLVTWRERLLRPYIGILIVMVCGTHIPSAIALEQLSDPTFILVLLLGAGSIGKEVSSGVLPLLFTRPLVRSRYVLAKWLALASAIALLSSATLLIEAAFMANRGVGLPGREVAAAVFNGVSVAFGTTAVLLFFSVLVPGYADVMVWAGLLLLPNFLQKYIPQRVTEEWAAILRPSLDWGAINGGASVGWFHLFSYLSTVTLCLCLAALAANRKELSYASG